MNCLSAFGLALVLGAPTGKEAAKDAPTLVGEWTCIKAVGNGKELEDAKRVSQIRFAFTADGKARIELEGPAEGTYTTDPKKGPAELDISVGAGKTARMIYKFEKDSLVLCFTKSGTERPTKFESHPGTGEILMTLERVKK
jgi:uncharacterized protein (TIGR03067 family)